jgi:hypothetical protein
LLRHFPGQARSGYAPCRPIDQTSRSRHLQRNEQVKALSNLAGNGGLAFLVAGAGRWFIEGSTAM